MNVSTLADLVQMSATELAELISAASLMLPGKIRMEAEKSTVKAPTCYDLSGTEQMIIRDGGTIAAIKAYKDRTGCGLRDAKDACDRYRATMTREECERADAIRDFRISQY